MICYHQRWPLDLFPRVTGSSVPRVKSIPKHYNSTSQIRQLWVNKVTVRYAVGTNIKQDFDGTFYCGKITSDNGMWYKVQYTERDKEELTNRQTTQIIEYTTIPFTTGFGATLLAIIDNTSGKSSKNWVTFRLSHSQLLIQSQGGNGTERAYFGPVNICWLDSFHQ